MKEIPPSKKESFMQAMSSRLPGIEKYQTEIFKRLAMALQNRRKYKRDRKRPRPKKVFAQQAATEFDASFIVE